MIVPRLLGAGCLLAMSACVAAPTAPQAAKGKSTVSVALRNAGFENAARTGERCPEFWGCTMHSDPDSFVFRLDALKPAEGKQALCIERVRREPWALATQAVYDMATLRGRKARFSMAVRIERAEGAGLGPWIVVHGPAGNLAHEEKLVAKTAGWERVAVEFQVAPTAQMVEVGATLQGGGRACLDDARLEILE